MPSITYSITTDSPRVLLDSIIVEVQRRCDAAVSQVSRATTKRDSIRCGAELGALTSLKTFLEAIQITPATPPDEHANGGATLS